MAFGQAHRYRQGPWPDADEPELVLALNAMFDKYVREALASVTKQLGRRQRNTGHFGDRWVRMHSNWVQQFQRRTLLPEVAAAHPEWRDLSLNGADPDPGVSATDSVGPFPHVMPESLMDYEREVRDQRLPPCVAYSEARDSLQSSSY